MGRFINADALVTTGQGLLGNNMFAYCGNNPVMYSDPTGEVGILFWSFVAVTVISAGANAFSTWMNGGSAEECLSAAIAGGAGGAAGFTVAAFCGFTPQGNIAGRGTATLVCDLGTALLTNGDWTTNDYINAGVDAVMDMSYSAVGYYYTAPVKNDLVQNTLNALFDAVVDIGETYLFYNNNNTNTQVTTQPGGNIGGSGGNCSYVALSY